MEITCASCEGFGEMSLGEDMHGQLHSCTCDKCQGTGEAHCGCGRKATAVEGDEPVCGGCAEVQEAVAA